MRGGGARRRANPTEHDTSDHVTTTTTPTVGGPSAQLERLPGRLVVGIRYVGPADPWLRLFGDLVVRHVAGDGGGLLHVMRCGEAGRRLRAGPAPGPRSPPAGSGGAP